MKSLSIALLAALLLHPSNTAQAARAKLHPPEAITAEAEDFLRAYRFESPYPVEFSINRLSGRLNLAHCETPLQIGFSENAKQYGKTHLKIKCSSGKRWQINLGVDLQVFHDIVTMKHALNRGVMVAETDLLLTKMPRSKIYTDFYSQVEGLSGLVTTMPVRAGQVVSRRLLSAADLVKKGQSVILVARAGGINITTRGKALNNAQRGQIVRVQNNDSGRIVEGVAVDLGKVEIPL